MDKIGFYILNFAKLKSNLKESIENRKKEKIENVVGQFQLYADDTHMDGMGL